MQRRTFLQAMAAALGGLAVANIPGADALAAAVPAEAPAAAVIDWTAWHQIGINLVTGAVKVDGADISHDPAALAMVRQFVNVPDGESVIKFGSGVYDLGMTNQGGGIRCDVPDDAIEFAADVKRGVLDKPRVMIDGSPRYLNVHMKPGQRFDGVLRPEPAGSVRSIRIDAVMPSSNPLERHIIEPWSTEYRSRAVPATGDEPTQ